MRKLIESTLVSLDGVIGSPDSWSPFDEEFTERPLDGIGLRLVEQTRPDRPALYAQPTDADKAPMRHVL